MIRDRKELEEHLREAIDRIKYKRKNIEEVNKTLSEYDVPNGFFNEVVKKESLLAEIDVSMLCLISIAVFKIDGSDNIRPETYYTENEINESKKHENSGQEIELPITLTEVLQLDYENYITKVRMLDLVKWYHSKIIVYDFETQRSPRYRKGKDGVIPIPDLNMESVKSIAESMLEETYLPDTIRLNIYFDEFDPITYNPKTKMFTIKKDAVVSILDGFHRLQGGIRAAMQNPDLPQMMELAIKMYDTDTAKKFFGQINTVNIVSEQRRNELKQEKVSYVSVKHLQINSDLKGKIASGAKVSAINDQLTTVDILANSIEEVFEPKNTFEAKEIGNYLAEYFNYLLGIYQEEFKNKESLIRHPRMFIGYVVFAKQFRDHNIPLNRIKDLIENLDITQSNEELATILTNNKGSSSRLQRVVRQYFEKLNVEDILKIGA